MRVWPDVVENIYWSIEDGRTMNFWNDVWIRQYGPLKEIIG